MSRIEDYTHTTDEEAVTVLETLIHERGRLQIITAVQLPNGFDPKDPRAFVCNEVIRVEGPDAKGQMVAYSGVGDWTKGRPAALLRRLLQRSHADELPDDHFGPRGHKQAVS